MDRTHSRIHSRAAFFTTLIALVLATASITAVGPSVAAASSSGSAPIVNIDGGAVRGVAVPGGYVARFHYEQAPVFNASTYLDFLHRLAPHYRRRGAILIQDNAAYHKDAEVWSWFKSNRHWLEVYQLPPYSPELNPTERLWQYTRKNGTHDRHFASQGELVATLTRVFEDMQSYPELIRPRLLPFC